MLKILMNGRFSVMNGRIWYANENYDNWETGMMKELKIRYRKFFITLKCLNSQQNVDRLKSFYTDIFKLEIIEEYESLRALMKAGNGNIGLHKIDDQYLNRTKGSFKFDSNCKIVFEVDENINEVRGRLLKQNVVMREIKTFDNYNYWLCDGEDPEGNVFQLKQKKGDLIK